MYFAPILEERFQDFYSELPEEVVYFIQEHC